MMKRREFVAGAAVLAGVLGFADPLVASVKPKISVSVNPGGWLEVTGSTEDLRTFVDVYQTSLWPDWKTHPNSAGRDSMEKLFRDDPKMIRAMCVFHRSVSKDGVARYHFVEASEKACRHFGVSFDINKVPHSFVLSPAAKDFLADRKL